MNRRADRRIRSGPAIAISLFLVLVVGYPLSVGPVGFLWRIAGKPEGAVDPIETFYDPLWSLPEPMQDLLWKWVDLWR
jgi:hypothetical protein